MVMFDDEFGTKKNEIYIKDNIEPWQLPFGLSAELSISFVWYWQYLFSRFWKLILYVETFN